MYLDHFKINPKDTLEHLGFKWNIKNRRTHIVSIENENIEERINKFWAVIHSLIKGGIRFCHPDTIAQLHMV